MDTIATAEAAPTSVKAGETPAAILARVRVLDADTGFEIVKVIEADAVAGKVTRFAQDEAGNLVRADDAFQVITEDRALRIEWREPASENEAA